MFSSQTVAPIFSLLSPSSVYIAIIMDSGNMSRMFCGCFDVPSTVVSFPRYATEVTYTAYNFVCILIVIRVL